MTDPSPPTPAPVGDLAYAEAVAELEAILESLEGDEPDVDHLAESVSRAAELIRECRARIASTRFEVERIVAELHPSSGTSVSTGTSPEGTGGDATPPGAGPAA